MDFDSKSRLERIATFVSAAGWQDAERQPLNQDASTRRYFRLVRPSGESAILMDAPGIEDAPCPPDADDATRISLGWNASTRLAASRPDAFVAIAALLTERGLSAPLIHRVSQSDGFVLMEDFGVRREFARLIERGEADEVTLYKTAAETLAHLHANPPPEIAIGFGHSWPILRFDSLALRTNANLFAEWLPQYDARVKWDGATHAQWNDVRDSLIDHAMALPRVFTLRDYHAENLIWLPDRSGVRRVGLLDFQDAVLGWAGWDLAMLTQDARRAVSPEAAIAALDTYCDKSGQTRSDIDAQIAIIGTLNALRIAGLFARLIKRDGKPRYVAFLDRQIQILARNLVHPSVSEMAQFIGGVAPHIRESLG